MRYDKRGVSADKSEVHEAIKDLSKGLFPNAFCKILPDLTAGDPEYCTIMHADTAGTKPSLAYLYWKETGDLSVWRGIVQDALIMNIDDLICVGACGPIVVSNTIGRNKNLIPGEVVKELIGAADELCSMLTDLGVAVTLAGGETADVGDIVRTLDVGFTAFSRMRKDRVIEASVRPGDVIVGLASFGQTTYEETYNGGMGSNGLTSARHDVLHSTLAKKYPESFDPALPAELTYCGPHALTDIEPETGLPVGKLLLSPTRTYAPVINRILERFGPEGKTPSDESPIHAIIHCSGGAQTKVLHFMEKNRVIKDNLFETPPLFKLIREASGTDWKELYKVFNMGHRMELYVRPEIAEEVIQLAAYFNLEARIIGRVEASETPEVCITGPNGKTYRYEP